MNFKKMFLFLAMVTFMVFAVACGTEEEVTDENNTGETTDTTTEDADAKEELSGSVVIDGSGTVYPLMARIAEEYMLTEQEDVSVEVSRAGTSAGYKKFVEGETDLSNASRNIKDTEVATLNENNIEYKEFKVALDGLTIVINPENDFAKEMTEEEIVAMFLKENGVETWSDVRSEWPSEKINFYGPNENHGTYEFFVEEILDEQELVEGINLQQEYSTLVDLVSKDKNGIGFFGYGYYANNDDKITAVAVDFGNGPVAPSLDTIAEDGDYAPFTRPVFTTLSINSAKEKAQVKDFAEYLFGEAAGKFAGETGFAPLPEAELKQSLEFVQSIK